MSSSDSELSDLIDEGNNSRMTTYLYEQIGRHHACVILQSYFDLLGSSHSRDMFSSPLHDAAVRLRNLEMTEALLRHPNTDKNQQNRHRETPLLLALKEKSDDEIINALMDNGCDCKLSCGRDITPLHIATVHNRIDIMLKLIEKGADVNASTDIGLVPLHLAILTSNYEAVCKLLEHGAVPDIVTSLAFTPLMFAVSYHGIDPRIWELLLQFDIQKETPLGSALLCAIKCRHPSVERLIVKGANVNSINSITGHNCLSEAIVQGDKHLFDLIWPNFDQNLFENRGWKEILDYFHERPGMKGRNLVECLKLILATKQGRDLLCGFSLKNGPTFIQTFFDRPEEYQLTKQDCWEIITSLPVVTYNDISYIYQKFGFDKELILLLKRYEVTRDHFNIIKTSTYLDFICFNEIESLPFNLKEILHVLKYLTPNTVFRTHFYNTFQCLANTSDDKLRKLQLLYKLCDETLSKRSIASLQEITRDKLRNIMFSCAVKPYKAIDELPVPDFFKEILFLKAPIYC